MPEAPVRPAPVKFAFINRHHDVGGTIWGPATFLAKQGFRIKFMRSLLLWLIGIPIPVILLLALCTHHF